MTDSLVQTLVDALKAQKAYDDHACECGQCMEGGHCSLGIDLSCEAQRLGLSALAAAEQANLPRMYSMEEIRRQMDEVYSEIREKFTHPSIDATRAGWDGAEVALDMLADRLEKPQ